MYKKFRLYLVSITIILQGIGFDRDTEELKSSSVYNYVIAAIHSIG